MPAEILIVEDEFLTAEEIKAYLETLGHSVTGITASGERAIQLADELRPDLILVDIKLRGGINGIDVSRVISDEYGIPVVYITASSDEATFSKALMTNPFGFIVKPFDYRDLRYTIEIALYKRQIDMRLRESELRYRRLVEDMPHLICRFDAGGRLTFVNSAFCDYFVQKSENLIGRSILDMVSEEDRQTVLGIIHGLTPDKMVRTYEHRVIASDGSIRWQRRTDRAFFDASGGIIEYQSIGEDITELKAKDVELRHAFAELDRIFNATATGMAIINADCSVRLVNSAFLRLFRCAPGDIIGRHCSVMCGGRLCGTAECMTERIKATGAEEDIELETKSFDGAPLVLMVHGVVLLPDDAAVGKPAEILLSMTDLTAMRGLEREITQAVESERRRMSQEIHDNLGQKLSYLGFLAELHRKSLERGRYGQMDKVEAMVHLIREAIDHARMIAKGLQPVSLDPQGFIYAVEEYIGRVRKLLGVSIRLMKKGDIVIQNGVVAANLYYIVMEAINNAVKHGHRRGISVAVAGGEERLIITITNRMKTSRRASRRDGEMGLNIMKHRAHVIGANLEARRVENAFVVEVSIDASRLGTA